MKPTSRPPLYWQAQSPILIVGLIAAIGLFVMIRGPSWNQPIGAALAFNNTTDTSPPSISIISPTEYSLLQGQVVIAVSAADNYGVSRVDFSVYDWQTNQWQTLGSDTSSPYTMTWDTFSGGSGQFSINAAAFDANGNNANTGILVYVNNTPVDTTPPTVTSGAPQGQLPPGTTNVFVTITTSEISTCRWSTTDVAYASMPNAFTSSDGTTHGGTRTGLADGNSYVMYVRCMDSAGNVMTTSYTLGFSIATGTPQTWDMVSFTYGGRLATLQEAGEVIFTINGVSYTIDNLIVADDGRVKSAVNGQVTKGLTVGQSATVAGKSLKITGITRGNTQDKTLTQSAVTLQSGAVTDSIHLGQTTSYGIKGKSYDVTLLAVQESRAKFIVNGVTSGWIGQGGSATVNGLRIAVSETLRNGCVNNIC